MLTRPGRQHSAATYGSLKGRGYSINDSIGVSGVERANTNWLRGREGQRNGSSRLDAHGDADNGCVTITKQVVPGKRPVYTLTADSTPACQAAAEQSQPRRTSAKSRRTSGGAGLLMRAQAPSSVRRWVLCDVLAIASWPGYDLCGWRSIRALRPMRACPCSQPLPSAAYEPLPFKLVTATTATCARRHARPTRTLYCARAATLIFPATSPPATRAAPTARWTCRAPSCSRATVTFLRPGAGRGRRAGRDGAPVRVRGKTGIDLPGEVAGSVANEADRTAAGGPWTGGDTIQAAIGQSENMMTPLQLAVYASTLAADGCAMRRTSAG